MVNINIGKMMTNRAFLSPKLEAFVGDNYRYTYEQVNDRVNQFASVLKNNGIKKDDRIAILCKNSQYFVLAFLAAAKIGAITVPLNWRLKGPELEYILKHSGSSLLIYDAEFDQEIEDIKPKLSVSVYIKTSSQGEDNDFEKYLRKAPNLEPKIVFGDDDPVIIMYTSGTTGKPKGAVLTHNNLFWASIGITHTIEWQYKDRFLAVAPFFHIGGLAPIVTNIHKGTTIVFMPEFNPIAMLDIIAKEKINNMMTVPLMLQALLAMTDLEKVDLSSVRTIICGGSPVPVNLIQKYKDFGIRVQNVYGITEYSGAVTFWTFDMGIEKCDSVGKPVFHGDILIIDPSSGEELPTGEIGEIVCTGPQVFKEYWHQPEETKLAIVNGKYFSGDLGKKDEDGFIYVVDRLKDMIISGGENIYSAELEEVIASHPAVAEVAVIGIPDSKWGEVPCAYVAKKPGKELTKQDIIDVCKENLANYKCVKEVRFVEVLPRNAVGKLLKTALREQANK